MSTTKTYLVWDPNIQGREEAGEYEAASPRFAAENYAEDTYDGFSEIFVIVEDPDGKQFEVNVDVDFTPTFDAHVKPVV